MPPRITEESNRPRVSDRTMVANLATTTLVRFKKTKGGVTITSMKPLGMGIRCLNASVSGPTTINITETVTHRVGGWMHESIRGRPAGGKKCLLTSPFIGLALRLACSPCESLPAPLLEPTLARLRAEQAIYTVNSFQFTRSARLILAYPTNGRRQHRLKLPTFLRTLFVRATSSVHHRPTGGAAEAALVCWP